MGNSFVIQNTKKSFEIKSTDGQVLKEFIVDVGNYETLEKWSIEIDGVSEIQERLNKENSTTVWKDLKELEEKLISMILGKDSWEWLWDAVNGNVVSLVKFLKDFQGFLNEQLNAQLNGYI